MSQGHKFHSSVLREYDVRGIVDDTLSGDDAFILGRSLATWMARNGIAGHSVCVGFDGRLSSPALEERLVAGLKASGCDVVRIGLGPTPMLYYGTHDMACDAGIMITGSHNPPDYNGFKFMVGGKPFYGAAIQALGTIATEGDFVAGQGTDRSVDIMDEYISALVAAAGPLPTLRVAWDVGNGATGEVLEKLVTRLPGEHVVLNGEIDGTFPAHHPDPTVPENLEQIMAQVHADNLDIGIAFDGDGDRLGVIDGQGRILWGDQIIALLARPVLRDRPGATIIADVKASQALFDEITRLGGSPLMWRTGHSCIKDKMAELKAPLAGEMSGHIFFGDRWFGVDDALYAALRLLSVIATEEQSISALHDSLPRLVNTPEIRFDCPDSRKFEVVEEVRERLAAEDGDVIGIDGVRVNRDGGWWLLRASNTQPVLVARCEAPDDAILEALKAELLRHLRACGVEPPQF